jgi:hypothetical protein
MRLCEPLLNQTEMISMDFSRCPLSKDVAPTCEKANHLFIRNIRKYLETIVHPGNMMPMCYNRIVEG